MVSSSAIREAGGRLRAVQAWARDHLADYNRVVPYRDEVLAKKKSKG